MPMIMISVPVSEVQFCKWMILQGTSADQDARFTDKKKKLIRQMKFEDVIQEKVERKVEYFYSS